MGIIMICCPSTGREVSTGIEMSEVERLPNVKATMLCPACGCVHEWTKRDAWLADGGEQYRAAAVGQSNGAPRAAAMTLAVASDRTVSRLM